MFGKKKRGTDWPKGPTYWTEGRSLFVSVPFTWNLPELKPRLSLIASGYDSVRVGGPAVDLLPDFLAGIPGVILGGQLERVLERVHPMATRTTLGCVNRCGFCGIGTGKIEKGGFQELEDWPDKPILCDNNLLAASQGHFDRVMDRLEKWGWADFNQGLDARLLTPFHAERLARIGKPTCRLALDSWAVADAWEDAFRNLRAAGVILKNISSYVLVGFTDTPKDAWTRCNWVEAHGIHPLPMWFHPLAALRRNQVTEQQKRKGWTDQERKEIMQFFYKRKGVRKYAKNPG